MMPNYATVSELKAFKVNGEVVDLVAFTDDELEDAIIEAEQFIEWLTGDWFYPKTVSTFIDGNGEYELFFPPWIPAQCLSLTSMSFVDGDGTTVIDSFTENQDFKLYEHYIRMIDLGGEGVRRIASGAGRWPRGEQNIKVIGVFGRAEVPPTIARVTKMLALERLLPGSNSLSVKDVAQVTWPDFSIAFKGSESNSAYPTSGYPEIDRLLQQFVNMSGLFETVPNG